MRDFIGLETVFLLLQTSTRTNPLLYYHKCSFRSLCRAWVHHATTIYGIFNNNKTHSPPRSIRTPGRHCCTLGTPSWPSLYLWKKTPWFPLSSLSPLFFIYLSLLIIFHLLEMVGIAFHLATISPSVTWTRHTRCLFTSTPPNWKLKARFLHTWYLLWSNPSVLAPYFWYR